MSATAEIEIERLDKEYLVFRTSRRTGIPSEFGPINYVHRYVIKTEDAMKILMFLNLSGFWNHCAEGKGDADTD